MMKETIRLVIRASVIILAVVVIVFTALSVILAKQLSFPKGLTLDDETQWAKDNNVWTDLSEYDTEEYTVGGKDGYTLNCVLVSNKETNASGKYVIISHGYNSNRYGAAKYVPIYSSLGYSCIIYDLRGHGENEKSICTIGNYESQDLLKIIDDTYERYGNDIYLGLHGESMGSSTSLSALKSSPNVRLVVADCGFTNLYELIGSGLDNMHIGFLEPSVDLAARLIYGWSMKDTSAIDAVAESEVPICFIHGADDTFITPDNSERLKAAARGYTELTIVEGAQHAESRKILGVEKYAELVENFLSQIEAE